MNCASAVRSIYIDKMIFIHGCHMISKILTHPIDMKLVIFLQIKTEIRNQNL